MPKFFEKLNKIETETQQLGQDLAQTRVSELGRAGETPESFVDTFETGKTDEIKEETNKWDGESGVIPEEPPVVSENIIPGKLLLWGIDSVMPRVIIIGAKQFGVTVKKKVSELKLTSDEIDTLEPAADIASKEIFKNISPLAQFFVALGSVYASKL